MERITTSGIWIEDGKVLVGRRRTGRFAGSWEFPGGKHRWGETEEETLKREFQEELGLRIKVGRRIFCHDFSNEDALYHLRVYLVEGPRGAAPSFQAHSEYLWADAATLEALPLVPSDRACLKAVAEAMEAAAPRSR